MFLLASSIHESLKEIASTIEPWYKHLETSSLGFKTIGNQNYIQETVDEMKFSRRALINSGYHLGPDVSISPEMITLDMVRFQITLAHKELFIRIENKSHLRAFLSILAGDIITFLMRKTTLRNWEKRCLISPETWNVDDVIDAYNISIWNMGVGTERSVNKLDDPNPSNPNAPSIEFRFSKKDKIPVSNEVLLDTIVRARTIFSRPLPASESTNSAPGILNRIEIAISATILQV